MTSPRNNHIHAYRPRLEVGCNPASPWERLPAGSNRGRSDSSADSEWLRVFYLDYALQVSPRRSTSPAPADCIRHLVLTHRGGEGTPRTCTRGRMDSSSARECDLPWHVEKVGQKCPVTVRARTIPSDTQYQSYYPDGRYGPWRGPSPGRGHEGAYRES